MCRGMEKLLTNKVLQKTDMQRILENLPKKDILLKVGTRIKSVLLNLILITRK